MCRFDKLDSWCSMSPSLPGPHHPTYNYANKIMSPGGQSAIGWWCLPIASRHDARDLSEGSVALIKRRHLMPKLLSLELFLLTKFHRSKYIESRPVTTFGHHEWPRVIGFRKQTCVGQPAGHPLSLLLQHRALFGQQNPWNWHLMLIIHMLRSDPFW